MSWVLKQFEDLERMPRKCSSHLSIEIEPLWYVIQSYIYKIEI